MKSWKKSLSVLFVILGIIWLGWYSFHVFRGDFIARSDFFIGPLRIHLYGLALALGVLTAWWVGSQLAGKFSLERSDIDNILLWVVIGGFLGARLYFVVWEWRYFVSHPLQIVAIWQGGLSIFGAILGGFASLVLYARVARKDFWNLADLVAVVTPIGQAVGRWGNFFNQEAFGRPTDLPWRMYIEPVRRPFEFLSSKFFHPTFLYESLWNLAVFAALLYMVRRGAAGRRGYLTAAFIIFYSLGRFFIEPLRLDSFFWHTYRVDQVVALVMVLVGAVLFIKSYYVQKAN